MSIAVKQNWVTGHFFLLAGTLWSFLCLSGQVMNTVRLLFLRFSSFSTSRELSESWWSLALALEFASGVHHVSPLSPPNTLEAFGLTYLCHQSTASTRCLQISETIVSLTNWQRSFHRSSVTAEPVLLIRSEGGRWVLKVSFPPTWCSYGFAEPGFDGKGYQCNILDGDCDSLEFSFGSRARSPDIWKGEHATWSLTAIVSSVKGHNIELGPIPTSDIFSLSRIMIISDLGSEDTCLGLLKFPLGSVQFPNRYQRNSLPCIPAFFMVEGTFFAHGRLFVQESTGPKTAPEIMPVKKKSRLDDPLNHICLKLSCRIINLQCTLNPLVLLEW